LERAPFGVFDDDGQTEFLVDGKGDLVAIVATG
jgi:hypothetical protein